MVALPRLLLSLFFLCTVLPAKAPPPPQSLPQSVCDTHILEHVLLLIVVTAPDSPRTYSRRSTWRVQSHSATKALTERTKVQQCIELYLRGMASFNVHPGKRFEDAAQYLEQWVIDWTSPCMCIFKTQGIPEN